MRKFNTAARKLTTFLLACFLWVHAIAFLNIQTPLVGWFRAFAHFSSSEVILVLLLVASTLLAGTGRWRMMLSLLYIYFFPFVLIGYLSVLSFYACRGIHRVFKFQAGIEDSSSKAIQVVAPPPSAKPKPASKANLGEEIVEFFTRPFRKFMTLWCILLATTAHPAIIVICLAAISVQLARSIVTVLMAVFGFETWFTKLWAALCSNVDKALDSLSGVSHESERSRDLEQIWNQLRFWKKIFEVVKEGQLISNWARLLACFVFGGVYVYISAIFSFLYFGIARLCGSHFSLTQSFSTALFLPFYATDLPKVFLIRLLGGIQGTVVVAVGVGTMMNFLRRKLAELRRSAAKLSERFSDEGISAKYVILEQKFASPASPPNTTQN